MAGRPVRAVDRLGRVTDSVFDLAGRNTQTQDKGLGGIQIPLVSSVTYDKASQRGYLDHTEGYGGWEHLSHRLWV